jgi:hypothetical protein
VGAHTAVSAYGWGTSLQESYGGRQLVSGDAVLTQSDLPAPADLDPRFCQEISSTTNAQCQAYPVKGSDPPQCAGHRNKAKKNHEAE